MACSTTSPREQSIDVDLTGGAAVFVPAEPPRAGRLAVLQADGDETVAVVRPRGSTVRRTDAPARLLPLTQALPALLTVDRATATPSLAAWATAATAAVGLIARGHLLPGASAEGYDAWRVPPLDADDAVWLAQLAASFPPEAHALAIPGTRPARIRSADALIRQFYDAVADTLVRTPAAALVAGTPLYAATEPQQLDRGLLEWVAEANRGRDAGARLVLRMDLAEDADVPVRAAFQLRSAADPSLLVDVADLWQGPASVLARFGAHAEADLLLALRRGAKVWPPLHAALAEATPTAVQLSDDDLTELLDGGTDALDAAGIEVRWPAELFADVTVRAVAGTQAPAPVTGSGLTAESLLKFEWRVAVGGEQLNPDEVSALAEAKRAVVRLRGRWVRADRTLLDRLRHRRPTDLEPAEALAAALAGSLDVDGEQVPFTPEGGLADLAARVRETATGDGTPVPIPDGLLATLRPYQRRGLTWLAHRTASGLGGCLADDMGLGKTVQVIALHLHRRPLAAGPTLVVCPTTLLGNWARELARFAPDVPVRRYHGGGRSLIDVAPDEVVLATYGMVRRDRAALAEVGWGLVVADEAQHAKNPLSRTARELRAIPSAARVALTGTPVENRLTELWSILDWTTPGLLGPLERFRTAMAVPVERYGDADAIERLTRLVSPFVLRRRKTDPGIAPELPAKTETDHIVPLSAEQATLYEAVVRETLALIAETTGMHRRGLVLKLLTALKQICNHPAQYLREPGPLHGRSGKLATLDELLEVILAEGEATLIFTQYVAMAKLLERHLAARGIGSLFLHGGVPPKRRDAMVAAFQSGAAPVFLLSLKAGGVGLNLTRATHVVHFDRWWNPAVEDQATDRAYRIGQDRAVQVHRLVTEGTLEDKIALILAQKRALAETVMSSGEAWLTELSDAELTTLVTLGETL